MGSTRRPRESSSIQSLGCHSTKESERRFYLLWRIDADIVLSSGKVFVAACSKAWLEAVHEPDHIDFWLLLAMRLVQTRSKELSPLCQYPKLMENLLFRVVHVQMSKIKGTSVLIITSRVGLVKEDARYSLSSSLAGSLATIWTHELGREIPTRNKRY